MKINVKRLYCEKCNKLVRSIEKTESGQVQFSCSICGKVIRFRDGVTWRSG